MRRFFLQMMVFTGCVSLFGNAPSLQAAYWTDIADTNWYAPGQSTFTLSNATQLAGLAVLVNGGITNFSGKTINLSADLDLSGREWTAIGNTFSASATFRGTFDGGHHTLSGLSISNRSSDYHGLFGIIGYDSDKNARVQNVNLYGSFISGREEVGGVAGYNNGTVSNVSVSACTITGTNYVGGVVGWNNVGCATLGSATLNCSVSGISKVGGVVGYNERGSVQSSCAAGGTVTGDNRIGGIVGTAGGGVYNCFNTADVTASGNFIGGVIGEVSATTIENCYSAGNVGGSGSFRGGIIGYTWNGTIRASYWRTGTGLPGTAIGTIDVSTTTNLASFTNSQGLLSSPAYGKTNLVEALNAWVATNAASLPEYRSWGVVSGTNGDFPVFLPRVWVTFSANGGQFSGGSLSTNLSYRPNIPYGSFPVASWAGGAFGAWTQDGGSTVLSPAQFPPAAPISRPNGPPMRSF